MFDPKNHQDDEFVVVVGVGGVGVWCCVPLSSVRDDVDDIEEQGEGGHTEEGVEDTMHGATALSVPLLPEVAGSLMIVLP